MSIPFHIHIPYIIKTNTLLLITATQKGVVATTVVRVLYTLYYIGRGQEPFKEIKCLPEKSDVLRLIQFNDEETAMNEKSNWKNLFFHREITSL